MDPACLMVKMSHLLAAAFSQEGAGQKNKADGLTTSRTALSLSVCVAGDWDSHVIKKASGTEGVT